jgi:threonine/homoserine/homoserine lactone efflux protein
VLTAILLGFVLGLRHASDPDHVIAVSAIVARHRRASVATWIGVAWGLGHSATILAVGSAIVALRLTVPFRLALGLELVVGVVLILLGLANLRAPAQSAASLHVHGGDTGLGPPLMRSLGVGLVHGLAGSAGVALLALAAMPTVPAALAYLAVFCVGTLAGMVAISLGLGVPLGFASRLPGAHRAIVAGSGVLSIAFGVWLVYDIGFVQILN